MLEILPKSLPSRLKIKVFDIDEQYMRVALQEAKEACDAGEVPVGAVVILDNQIIGRGHNLTETLHDVTAHAEMQAITAAMNTLGAKYLVHCTLYVTLEPCVMCAGAILNARIARLVYATPDPKRGYSLFTRNLFPDKMKIDTGVLSESSAQLLKQFFAERR